MASDSAARQQIQTVSEAILEETRSAVLVALRFMGPALYAMPFMNVRLHRYALATDGRRVGADALRVARAFRDDPNELLRAYLHLVLHCVYRHPFDGRHPRRHWWDIACDVTVGATAQELVGGRFPCKDDDLRTQALQELQEYCPVLTAPKIYRAIAATLGADKGGPEALPEELVERLKALFACDDHTHWPRRERKFQNPRHLKGVMTQADYLDPDTFAPEGDEPDGRVAGSRASAGRGRDDDPEATAANSHPDEFGLEDEEFDPFDEWPDDLDEDDPDFDFDPSQWDDISKQIQEQLEAYRNRPNFEPGTLVMNLKTVNRRKSDYRQFLKRFASIAEEVQASPDEFDYIYYTYGLGLYENMPLVEPLEYYESIRVREFVIAIDTSASCSGDLVRHFVEQTYSILKSAEGFGSSINVHIVQCDAQIRDVIKVKNAEELDEYFTGFEMRGFGDTDFRPVFDYVDEAIASGEFRNLKGIVYLTDGEGEYPTYRPAYDAVFVFVENNPAYIMHVPPWAMKVIMDEDQIIEL